MACVEHCQQGGLRKCCRAVRAALTCCYDAAGTNRATRYICLLDELGFGPDGLHVFTYWMCYLYCRCTR